jgi:hypothetical protein
MRHHTSRHALWQICCQMPVGIMPTWRLR